MLFTSPVSPFNVVADWCNMIFSINTSVSIVTKYDSSYCQKFKVTLKFNLKVIFAASGFLPCDL